MPRVCAATIRSAKWRCNAARSDLGVRRLNVTKTLPKLPETPPPPPHPPSPPPLSLVRLYVGVGSEHANVTKSETSSANASSAAAVALLPVTSVRSRHARSPAHHHHQRPPLSPLLPMLSAHPPSRQCRVGPPMHTTRRGPGRSMKSRRQCSRAVASQGPQRATPSQDSRIRGQRLRV